MHLPPFFASAFAALDGAWVEQARDYQRARLLLGLASLALTPLALWLFLRLGWSAGLRTWLEERGLRNPWLLVAAYSAIALLLGALASLPLDYAGLALRRSYGLSQQSTLDWLRRAAIAFVVGLVVALVAVQGLYALLRWTPRTWWLWAGVGATLLSVVLAYLGPLVITPLFYQQRPLEDAELRGRILTMAERAGLKVEDVFVIDASSTGNEGNAYFTGVGGSTRIVLYDTLVQQYPADELTTVLAHEMGHWREGHVKQSLLLTAVLGPLGLLVVHLLLGRLLPGYGVRGPADIAGLPLLVLLITLGSTLLLPAQNWLSRRWERAADDFALRATADPDAFIGAFERLARQNLADPSPSKVVEAIFYSHPPISQRIAAAERSRTSR